jgi:two-component system sensor histidine kinase BaeS
MMQTFNGLLRLIGIDTGKRREAITSFNLSSLTNKLVESYEPVFVDVGRQLSSLIIHGIRLNGDAVLFSQILNNLLENSIEHGQARCNIWVRLQAYRDAALVQVRDDGLDIPVDDSE